MKYQSALENKTILVTGATGFIGARLVNRLRQVKNARLLLLSRKPVADSNKGGEWICSALDQLTSKQWRQAGVEQIDAVFHLGAFIPKSTADANHIPEVFRDNLIGTRVLLESLPSVPECVVFASTVDVYGPLSEAGPLNEESALGPATLYGASKLFCEKLVQTHANQLGCRCAILRYGHIYGPGEEAYAKLIPQLIRRQLQGESPVLYGDGSAERDFLFVDDAVEATLRAAVSSDHRLGPVNIVRGTSVPIRTIAEILAKCIGVSRDITYLKDKPKGYSLRFDNSLMSEVLGTWNLISLEDGLKREVEYFRSISQ